MNKTTQLILRPQMSTATHRVMRLQRDLMVERTEHGETREKLKIANDRLDDTIEAANKTLDLIDIAFKDLVGMTPQEYFDA